MPPIYTLIISLKRSEARRTAVEDALKLSTLNWEILEGIDGLQLQHSPPEYRETKVTKMLGFPLTPSEVGCFLSHRLAWIKCIEKNSLTLILEDDFLIKPNFEESLSILTSQYLEWDIARLQGLVDTPDSTLQAGSNYQIVTNREDPLGATAYLIKPEAARKLIQHSIQIYEPLDHFLEHHQKHALKIIAFKPYPIETTGMITTMHDRSDRRPITGFKKKLRSLYRAIDRAFNPNPWFPK